MRLRRRRRRQAKRAVAVPVLDARAFGKRIRRVRASYGWDQRDLADKLGTDHSVICLYEAGKRMPRLGRLIALAVALRRSLDFLLFGVARRGELHRLAKKKVPGERRYES